MNTYDVLTAGAADCPRSTRGQPTTPGYPHNDNNHNVSLSLLPKGRDVREGECFSFEAEARTLGCILLDAKVAFNFLVTAEITAAHFYDLRNKELFRIMERMHKAGHEVDPVTVLHRFSSSEWAGPDPMLIRTYIAALPAEVPSVWSLPTFIDELKDMHQRRLALDVARRLMKVAGDKSAPSAQLLEDSENAFRQLRNMAAPKSFTIRSASELAAEQITESDNLLADRLLARGQSLTLLGAGGIGKSRLLLQLAACCISGRPFLGLRVISPTSNG